MKRKIIVLLAALVIVIGLCAGLTACGGASVTVTGSSSVAPLMQELAAEFEKNNEGISIKITVSDSSAGITDTKDGKNDFGMASRGLKTAEEADVEAKKIADDGVVLIAHKDAQIDNVTNEQIYNLYANGTAIDGINAAISREEGSGTRDAFDGLIADADGKKLSALEEFSKSVQIQNSTGLVMTEIASNANKIGYISLGSLNGTVKALKFNGVTANSDTIKDESYKLSRPFNVVIKKGAELSENAQKFLDFILGEEGQKIVANKYIPIK